MLENKFMNKMWYIGHRYRNSVIVAYTTVAWFMHGYKNFIYFPIL
jgi:hypothetical protein